MSRMDLLNEIDELKDALNGRDIEIESLRQQLAGANARIEAMGETALNQQKREVMLQNALALIAQTATLDTYRIASKALAATTDLDKYVLCEKEPRAWSWENKNVKGNWYLSWREPEPGFNKTPLYRAAKEQGK